MINQKFLGKRVRIQPNAAEETNKKAKHADDEVVEEPKPATVIVEEATPAAYTQHSMLLLWICPYFTTETNLSNDSNTILSILLNSYC